MKIGSPANNYVLEPLLYGQGNDGPTLVAYEQYKELSTRYVAVCQELADVREALATERRWRLKAQIALDKIQHQVRLVIEGSL
jgi:hypothetical protein